MTENQEFQKNRHLSPKGANGTVVCHPIMPARLIIPQPWEGAWSQNLVYGPDRPLTWESVRRRFEEARITQSIAAPTETGPAAVSVTWRTRSGDSVHLEMAEVEPVDCIRKVLIHVLVSLDIRFPEVLALESWPRPELNMGAPVKCERGEG